MLRGKRDHQGQRQAHRAGGAGRSERQGPGASAPARQAGLRRGGHQNQSHRRRLRLPDLRHQDRPEQGPGRLPPEIRGRGLQETDQGDPAAVRQVAAHPRPEKARAQARRRKGRQGQEAEVLQMI